MFCQQCGHQIPKGSAVCEKCDTPASVEQPHPITEEKSTDNTTSATKKKVNKSEAAKAFTAELLMSFITAFLSLHIVGWILSKTLFAVNALPYYGEIIALISIAFTGGKTAMKAGDILDESRESKSENNKPFYKQIWFWAAILAVGIVGNIITNIYSTDTPKGILRDYVVNKMPVIQALETKLNLAYDNVAGDNYTDDMTLYVALKHEIVPDSIKWMEKAQDLNINDDRLYEIHEKYVKYAVLRYEALELYTTALENQDMSMVLLGNEKMELSSALLYEYVDELEDYCEELGVESKLDYTIYEVGGTADTNLGLNNDEMNNANYIFDEFDELSLTEARDIFNEWMLENNVLMALHAPQPYSIGDDDFYITRGNLNNKEEVFLMDMGRNIYSFNENTNDYIPVEEWLNNRSSGNSDMTVEEAHKLIDEQYLTLPNAIEGPSIEYYQLGELDGMTVHEFWSVHPDTGEREGDLYVVDVDTSEVYLMNARGAYLTFEEYYQLVFQMTDPWTGINAFEEGDDYYAESSQSITAIDLLGQWIWDTNSEIDKVLGSNMKQVTFLSNGTCNGGVAMSYTDLETTLDGVNSILTAQYWSFLEYEQILQVQGYQTDLNNRQQQKVVNYNVSIIGDTLYLVNTNDKSTEKVVYTKNNQ